MKDIISRIKSKAKQLTIDISQIGDGCTKEQLHGDSLELLLDIHELETSYNKAYQDSPASPKIVKGVINHKPLLQVSWPLQAVFLEGDGSFE